MITVTLRTEVRTSEPLNAEHRTQKTDGKGKKLRGWEGVKVRKKKLIADSSQQ